ncbi:MAG: TonB-dependent receptor [Beijerinckiaceae bacterium]
MSNLMPCLLAGVALLPCAALAQQASAPLTTVVINTSPLDNEGDQTAAPGVNRVSGQTLATIRATSPDSAQALTDTAGVSLYQAGGLSSLPVTHGLNDDRNAIVVGGIPITAACANHMNPPMSYIDPGAIANIEVLTADIPVSKGGDSIGGTIIVTRREPVFAEPAQKVITKPGLPVLALDNSGLIFTGSLSAFYRSNNRSTSLSGAATAATEHFSVNYTGSWSRGDDYQAGGGALVRSTNFEAENHAVTLAYRNEDQLITLRGSYQNIPYQGFVNQYMDMLGNESEGVDLSYKGGFGWGKLETNAFYQHTQHYMNFLADKNGGVDATPTTGMPMYTDGVDFGYSIKAEIAASKTDLIRIGNEFHGQRLNDWWQPVNGMMGMMCCSTFENINGGQRDRLGTYGEWERKWSPQWTTLLGIRNDIVWMNTGDVQGYNNGMMYAMDAANFNAVNHAKTDVNFDATALVRFTPDTGSLYEAGYTRKTRSPNLDERYAWSTTMATMVGWFGDGNGYVGNINLKPEVAHTLSASAVWHDSAHDGWEAKVTPYYSYVQDYIDVDQIGVSGSGANQINLLQFANHDAELYGFDLSGRVRLLQSTNYGNLTLSGIAAFTHGRRIDDGSALYHMMPINGKATLEHRIAAFGGQWINAVEVQAVGAKTDVETVRLEPTTPAYGLVNLRSGFEINNLRFDVGVENLFDQLYYSPLGGIDIADNVAVNSPLHSPVAGMGRTIYGGMTVKF